MDNLELFLYELSGHGYEFSNKAFADGQFEDDQLNMVWEMWNARIPDGFILNKKRVTIGNPDVDFSQAPIWAKYWLKDGYSDKYWWSSTRPTKDMDLEAFCWKGGYSCDEAPSFGYTGEWHKSMTSRKDKEKEMTIEEIRKNKPDWADYYHIAQNGLVTYYKDSNGALYYQSRDELKWIYSGFNELKSDKYRYIKPL